MFLTRTEGFHVPSLSDNLVSRQKKPELSSPFSLTYLLSGLIRRSNHDCVTYSQSYEEVENVAQFWTQMG